MTSVATSNQVQNYISPAAKSVITSTIKGKLPDTKEKKRRKKLQLDPFIHIKSATVKHNINNT